MLLLTGLYVAIATAIHLAIAAGAAEAHRSGAIRRVLSVLLARVALWLARSTRR